MNSRPIGIFDSGVGGMTVLAEIAKELPNEDLIYLGDTKNFPYGDKSKENIIKISKKCVEFLISKNVKLIIIACGTATSQALEELRKEINIPILGIISPTVDSIRKSLKRNSKSIVGVIATEGTIRSNKGEQELEEKIEDITEVTIEESCRFTCMNLPYRDVVRILKAGPSTRGQQRLKYVLKDGSQQDIYGLILKILADNPPLVELRIDELMERIKNNTNDNMIKQKKVKDSLKNWQRMLEQQGSLYQVLEWKDDVIYILDNMFLFYIRWGLERRDYGNR